jgi:thymidylate kinase
MRGKYMNPKMLIFEGIDKTGKSTLLQAVWKKRKKIDTCVDRGIISNIAYNKYYSRNVKNIKYSNMYSNSKNQNIYIIYCVASKICINQRATYTNHKKINYDLQHKMFEYAIQEFKKLYKHIKIIKIDTTNLKVNKAVNKIISEIGE